MYDKDAEYAKMLAALQEIARLSNEFNPERNAYAARLEEIAHSGFPDRNGPSKTKKHEGCIRGFTILSEAWYGPANLPARNDVKEQIMIGMYHPEGGTSGEFAIRWIMLSGKLTPRLEVFNDAWHALWQFADLLERLPDFDSQDAEPSRIIKLLKDLGCKDLTERESKS